MDKQSIQFRPKVVGDPIKFQRVWMAVHEVSERTRPIGYMTRLTITVWQDGAWWCMTVHSGSTVRQSTWGTARTIIDALSDYGTITGINHIDFTHLK